MYQVKNNKSGLSIAIVDKNQLILVGTIASLLGCLTILLLWLDIYYEDSYGTLYLSYNGITLITSGDFTNPDGLFYGVGLLGVYTPTLICLAFIAMSLRYIIRVYNRRYMGDVTVTGVLIIIGSVFMMYWSGSGNYSNEYYTVVYNFGAGPIVSIIMAVICMVIANSVDKATIPQTNQYYNSLASVVASYNEKIDDNRFVAYCPNCGNGRTAEDAEQNYCKYCGAFIGKKSDQQ